MGLAEELAKKYGIKGVGQEAIVGLIVNQVLELAAQEADRARDLDYDYETCTEIAARIRKLKE